VLDSGERVMFERQTGATEAGVRPVASWAHETVEMITRDVLTTVLPDDDDTDDEHPWEWLAELAQARGIDVTVDDLQQVPYEVVLTERHAPETVHQPATFDQRRVNRRRPRSPALGCRAESVEHVDQVECAFGRRRSRRRRRACRPTV
jgi:hypothetical protein